MSERYFVVDHPGRCGATSTVYSHHTSLAAALKAAGSDGAYVTRVGDLRKGDTWHSNPASEHVYPIARGPGRPSLGAAGLSRGLTIKISDAQHAQWSAAAERESVSLGEWLRAAAELAIARGSTR